jgi:hypothetical protein
MCFEINSTMLSWKTDIDFMFGVKQSLQQLLKSINGRRSIIKIFGKFQLRFANSKVAFFMFLRLCHVFINSGLFSILQTKYRLFNIKS